MFPTADQHDAIAAVELARAEAEWLAGRPLRDLNARDVDGSVLPLIAIVTDNGGPFRSFRFEAFIATHPELRHVGTRVRSPGQNGFCERGFGSLKFERLFLEEIDDVRDFVTHAERYRVDYNTAVRQHEALSWNRPTTSTSAWPIRAAPTSPIPKSCQLLDAGHPPRVGRLQAQDRQPGQPTECPTLMTDHGEPPPARLITDDLPDLSQ